MGLGCLPPLRVRHRDALWYIIRQRWVRSRYTQPHVGLGTLSPGCGDRDEDPSTSRTHP